MRGFVILSAYVVGAIACVWPFQQTLLKWDTLPYRKPDAEDQVFAAGIASVFAVLWPLVLFCFAAFRLSRRVWTGHAGADDATREQAGQ